jgi:PKD repeat protein/endonuclease/exonuclease/phosphatase family metal-dependent hydrolase
MLAQMCSIKSITHCFARIGAVLCVVCGFATLASAQTLTLRVACYNIDADTSGTAPNPGLINPSGGGPTTSGGVLEGIGEELLSDGVAQPIDILALEETSGTNATVAPIVAGLNAYYGQYNPLDSSMYAMAPQGYLTTGTGNGPNAMVYNTKTVQLVATVAVDPLGGPGNLGSAYGEYREVMRYEFAPAGQTPTAAAEFYVYVSHYKAGTTSGDETDRNGEARIIRTNEAMLPANARVVYVGDYNPDNGSSETGYQTIIAANSPTGVAQGQGVDPLNVSGSTTIDWEDTTTNKTILFMLTEESYELRYRDDLQICTTNVYSGAAGGLALVASTYHAFGNNASLAYGSSVIANGNTALNDLAPGSHISASTLYSDLTGASDHLPVVADYTIPVVQPGAVFTAAPASGAYPSLTVTFTDASTGIVTNWFWNFGDGATSNTTTTTSVKHTYTTAGVYTVAETVTGPGGTNTNTQTGLISVSQIAPVVSWGNPAAITYGAILTSSQLNATANVPGSFAYTPTNGTVPFAGTDTLSVIFTPTNTVDYSSVTNTVSLVVSLAPLTVTASNASRQVGASNPMFIGTITGLQNNDNITATYSCAATPASPAGPYAIVPTLVDPNGLRANYSVTTNNGTLTVISIPPPNIQSVTQSNGTVTFVWVSVAGQSYQVQSSTNLTGSNWFNLGGSNVANGASTAASDSVTNTQQYYRVLLLQP